MEWTPELRAALERIGRNAKLARVELDKTQEQCALDAGMARSHWSQLERGTLGPSIPTLMRMAKVLGVTPADLLRGVGDD